MCGSNCKGANYLTTLSHLRLVCSDDGINFYELENYPLLISQVVLESFSVEDCCVSCMEDMCYRTYTAVSPNGVGVGLQTTVDWKNFQSHGMIFPPHNKHGAVFEEKNIGMFYALHRSSSVAIGEISFG